MSPHSPRSVTGPSGRPARRRGSAVGAALVGLVLLAGCGGTAYVDSSGPGETTEAPRGWTSVEPVALPLPTDRPLAGGGAPAPGVLEGPTVVNVWASWCEPCRDELPLLQRVSRSGRLTVVGVSRDVRAAPAEDILAELGVRFPNWRDPRAALPVALDGRIPINAIPSSVLVVDGEVRATHIGEFDSAREVTRGLRLVE